MKNIKHKVIKKIRCKCGLRIKIINPYYNESDRSGKSHAHCKRCGIEWHWTLDGRIYYHKLKKKIQTL